MPSMDRCLQGACLAPAVFGSDLISTLNRDQKRHIVDSSEIPQSIAQKNLHPMLVRSAPKCSPPAHKTNCTGWADIYLKNSRQKKTTQIWEGYKLEIVNLIGPDFWIK